MENTFYVDKATNNGQELPIDDVNAIAETAGLADDRVLAELLRLEPYQGGASVKAVLPFGIENMQPGDSWTWWLRGYYGGLLVMPFRAFVGSRTPVTDGNDMRKAWRDIRSGVFIGLPNESIAIPNCQMAEVVGFESGDGVNPRWDLVCAKITVDATQTATRYRKDPTTRVVTAASRVYQKTCPVVLQVVQGTAGASPAFPTLPSDSGSDFYIPIALVPLPLDYAAGAAVSGILECAPVARMGSSAGVPTLQPANSCFDTRLPMLATNTPWTVAAGRPKAYLPATMNGGASRIIPMSFAPDGSPSVANGDVLDDSIDWSNRIFKWSAFAGTSDFAWTPGATPPFAPNGLDTGAVGVTFATGGGQSFAADSDGKANVAIVSGTGGTYNPLSILPAYLGLGVYVESGKLKARVDGLAPTGGSFSVLFWIEASGQFQNA